MFEDEDAILPDDYQADQPQSEEAVQETHDEDGFGEPEQTDELTTDTEATEAEQQEAERQAFLKVKYNKEEMDLDEQTARELAQKGLNYDKLQERLQQVESDPRLSFVEELAREQGMEPQEFLEAVRSAREQQKLDDLVQQNIPEEYAKEMLESRKFREQMEAEKQLKAETEKQNAEFEDFFQYYKQANGKDFDPKEEQIPQEVWDAHSQGTPLRYAYMEHHANQLKAQIQVLKQNEENSKKAPVGSVTAHGSTEVASEDDFLRGFNSI